MVDFAGYELPVFYRGIVEEHLAVRERAGIFDISHMGEIRVAGSAATAYLQRLLSNDIARVSVGGSQYELLLNDEGGIIDDLFATRVSAAEWLLVVNAANRAIVVAWLTRHAGETHGSGKARGDGRAGAADDRVAELVVEDLSDSIGLVALQGPLAEALVAPLLTAVGASSERRDAVESAPGDVTGPAALMAEAGAPPQVSALTRFQVAPYRLAGVPVLLSRTGYTGEDGFEIFVAWDDTPVVWRALHEAGAEPCGLGSRDTLRLEMCYPLHGNDISAATDPLEAGLGWAVALDTPEKDFIGREALLALRESRRAVRRGDVGIESEGQPVASEMRSLVVFDLPDGGIPRAGCSILRAAAATGAAKVVGAGAVGEVIGTGVTDEVVGIDAADEVVGTVTSGSFSPSLRVGIGMGYVRGGRPAAGGELVVDVRGKPRRAVVQSKPLYKGQSASAHA